MASILQGLKGLRKRRYWLRAEAEKMAILAKYGHISPPDMAILAGLLSAIGVVAFSLNPDFFTKLYLVSNYMEIWFSHA